eukprot:XP_011534183.1 androgen-induced gene 1 protein isoform X1 [Homo sapiens]
MALVPCQVLRMAILLSYCSILCNYKAIEMPSHQTYGGSWKFLTFIDLVIQAVFFGICVLTDLSSLLTRGSGNQEQERQLKKLISLRDWMLAVLAFPVGVFVVAVFWIIYAYDREMIYPKLLDNFIPGWLNHGMGVLGASCNWHVGVPFPGTHWPRSQNHLLWVYNHLNELPVPAGRSSEQLYLGYTEKASILARHVILSKLCKTCPKCMYNNIKIERWKKRQHRHVVIESCMKIHPKARWFGDFRKPWLFPLTQSQHSRHPQ